MSDVAKEEFGCFMGMTPDEWEVMYADFVARYPSEPIAQTENAAERRRRIDRLCKQLARPEYAHVPIEDVTIYPSALSASAIAQIYETKKEE